MKTTKKYLKILTMFVVMSVYIMSFAAAILLGITGVIGMFSLKNFITALLLVLVAIVFGFITSVMNDLMEWLDKKFRPY